MAFIARNHKKLKKGKPKKQELPSLKYDITRKDFFEMPMKKLPSIAIFLSTAKFLLGASPNTYSCSP
jgi:hypothetical protein